MLKLTTFKSAYSSLQCCSICCPHSSPYYHASQSKTSSTNARGNATTSNSHATHTGRRPTTRLRNDFSQLQNDCFQRRSYASVHGAAGGARKGPDFRDNMNWPCGETGFPSSSSKTTKPTPYEIFAIGKHEVYSKKRYYELVKLYHPDRNGHHYRDVEANVYTDAVQNNSDGSWISRQERLERYRLVVQAHEILSDPVKRRAYDAYGAGWEANTPTPRGTPTRHSRGYSSSTAPGRDYGFGPEYDNSPFGNATWEDWERWYRRQRQQQDEYTNSGGGGGGFDGSGPSKNNRSPNDYPGQAYEGNYINPNAFASFVILMAVLTGILQATRAGQYSQSLGEKAQAFTEETNQFMSSRAAHLKDTAQGSDARVKHFLEKRDPTRYGLKDEEEEMYRRVFAGHPHQQQQQQQQQQKRRRQRRHEEEDEEKRDGGVGGHSAQSSTVSVEKERSRP